MTPPERSSPAWRAARLRRSQDFRAIMRSGRRARHPLLHLAVRCNDLPQSRFGFSVGKRVGNAVARNRVKRRLRAIMRELPVRPGLDVVSIAQEAAAGATYGELRGAALHCLTRADALPGDDR